MRTSISHRDKDTDMRTIEKFPVLVRRISIVLTTSSLVPHSFDALAGPQDTGASDLNSDKGIHERATKFKALGRPYTMLSIYVQPSTPMYFKKGSLMALYGIEGSALTLIKTKLHLVDPLKSLLYGGSSFMYQRCISTVPFSMLLSPKGGSFFESNGQKTFATLALDGRYDWALLNKSALQVYAGNNLNISKLKKPKYLSKKLSRLLDIPRNSQTGLSSWTNLGYTLLSGRGEVGLVGNGSIYTISLKESEEIIINSKLLLALSVNGPYDLENCVVKYKMHLRKDNRENEEIVLNMSSQKKFLPDNILSKISSFYRMTVPLLLKTREKLMSLVNGVDDFIKIIGPRTLFLESNCATSNKYLSAFDQIKLNKNSSFDKNPSDYLNYATISEHNQAKFTSTPDFEDSIRKKAEKPSNH